MEVIEKVIPGGDAGTVATLQEMGRLIRSGAGADLTAATACAIYDNSYREVSPSRGLRRWLASVYRFTPDPEGVEQLQDPVLQLQSIAQYGVARGDCDDAAILGGALGCALGWPVQFVVYAFDVGGEFAHVFTEVDDGSGWYELDVTRPMQRVPRPTRVMRWTV